MKVDDIIMNPQSPLAVANYFIEKSNRTATPLQLIKLTYISYGYILAITDKQLFIEPIEAWRFGPVIPSVYHTFKHYGSSSVTELSYDFDMNADFTFKEKTFSLDVDSSISNILNAIWYNYGSYDGFQLVDMTHEHNTPWSERFNGNYHETISENAIKEHYMEKIKF